MKNNHNILRGIMTTITTVCVCIVLSLCALTGYAAETGGDPPPQPSGETETTSFPLPIRENPVAAGYHDFYVIREDGTLIKSTTNYDKGSRNGFTFNYTVEVMDNAAAVYVGCDAIDDVLVVDQDGTLWVNRPAYYGIELMPGEETDGHPAERDAAGGSLPGHQSRYYLLR